MGRSKESLQITWLRELGGTSQELQCGPLPGSSGSFWSLPAEPQHP